jgi:hypothetical protein
MNLSEVFDRPLEKRVRPWLRDELKSLIPTASNHIGYSVEYNGVEYFIVGYLLNGFWEYHFQVNGIGNGKLNIHNMPPLRIFSTLVDLFHQKLSHGYNVRIVFEKEFEDVYAAIINKLKPKYKNFSFKKVLIDETKEGVEIVRVPSLIEPILRMQNDKV